MYGAAQTRVKEGWDYLYGLLRESTRIIQEVGTPHSDTLFLLFYAAICGHVY